MSDTSRALVQGGMMGAALAFRSHGILVKSLEQDRDGEGNYLPFFVLIMDSGVRIRVTFEEEPDG